MHLSEFLRLSSAEIVSHSVEFARSLGALSNQDIDVSILRDHLPLVLEAIASDLEQPQSRAQSIAKSEGMAVSLQGETAAQTHGRLRAGTGLSVAQVVAEYRVLRSVVIRLWSDHEKKLTNGAIPDLIRFNEAIDQAIAESVAFHSVEVERWRDMMLAVVSHDLRGPVQAIVATSELLSSRAAASFPSQVELLGRASARLSVLLDSLLDYSKVRLGSGLRLHRRMVDLAEECRSEIELIRAAQPGVAIELSVVGSVAGQFDAGRVREALANLVSNAVQYRAPETAIRVIVEGSNESVFIAVVNEGEVIAPEVLQNLFEPLRRREISASAGPRRNLGIGLFVVREIAKAHGGDVAAVASDGKVTFSMLLPKQTAACDS